MINPRLLAISGSFEGTNFALDKSEISIGRDKTNDIRIPDRSISRRHCVIKTDGEHFTIVDFGSFNGTFVNGAGVKQQSLNHGDRVTLGDVRFLFFEHEAENEAIAANMVEPALISLPNSTIRLEKKDALYLNPAQVLQALLPNDT